MYSEINTEVYQGDILSSYNFLIPPIGKPFAVAEKGESPVPITDIIAAGIHPKQIIANTIETSAIIITQTCDAQRREFISVCPIFPLEQMKHDLAEKWGKQRVSNFIEDLRNHKINYYLYLPAINTNKVSVPESYVDLQVINSLPLQNLENYTSVV